MHHVLQLKVLDARFGTQWELPAYAPVHRAGVDLGAALGLARIHL